MKIVFDRWLNSDTTKRIFEKYDVNRAYFKREFENKFITLFSRFDSEIAFEIVDYFEDKSIEIDDLMVLFENLKYSFDTALPPLIEKDFFKLFKIMISKYNKDSEGKEELLKLNKLLSEYKKAVDLTNIVSKTDLKGNITYINDKFCEISGYSPDELIGKPHNIVRHPNMPKEAFANLWETIKNKKVWSGIVENLKKNGDSYFVDTTILPILNENDEIVEYISIRHDITELILKTKEIEELKAKQMRENVDKAIAITIEATIKNMPIATLVINSKDFIIAFNEEFENLFDMFEDKELLEKLKDKELNLRAIFNEELKNEEPIDWKEEEFSEYKFSLIRQNLSIKLKIKKIEECEENRYLLNLIIEDSFNGES